MTLTHQLYRCIDDVEAGVWEACIDEQTEIFARRDFLRAVERSMRDTEFQHVVFRNPAGNPVAVASLCLYRIDGSLLAEGMARTVAQFVGRIARPLIHVPVVICGLPVSAGQSNLRMRPDADVGQVLRGLDAILYDWARRSRARAIVFKEFDEQECARLSPLEEYGYRRADSLPMNRTEAEFADFDAYLEQLKARRRYPIRKARQKFAGSGLSIIQKCGGDGAAQMFTSDVHELYLAVLDRAEVKFERLPVEFFQELARQCPENSWFTFVVDEQQQGRPVLAFAVSVFSRKSYHQMFVGVNYDRNADCDLYFNVFFHAIDAAFQRQTDEIHVGQSADEFKRQKFSCWHQPLSFYVKPVGLAARGVFAVAFDGLFPSHPARPGEAQA